MTGTAFHVFPPRAAIAISRVMAENAAAHGDQEPSGEITANNWRKLAPREHVDHGTYHLMKMQIALRAGNVEEYLRQLKKVATRFMFALETALEEVE